VAAWWLGGHGSLGKFAALILGLSLLIFGCTLFKLTYHSELSSLGISYNLLIKRVLEQKHWWVICLSFLGIGLMVLLWSGDAPAFLILLIGFFLITYGILYRASPMAALFIGLARLCVYFLAASESVRGISGEVVWKALAIAGYSGGASLAVRGRLRHPFWGPACVLWMSIPILLALLEAGFRPKTCLLAGLLGFWIWICCSQLLSKDSTHQPYSAADLVTGTILVDLLAIGGEPFWLATILGITMLFMVVLQRKQLVTNHF